MGVSAGIREIRRFWTKNKGNKENKRFCCINKGNKHSRCLIRRELSCHVNKYSLALAVLISKIFACGAIYYRLKLISLIIFDPKLISLVGSNSYFP